MSLLKQKKNALKPMLDKRIKQKNKQTPQKIEKGRREKIYRQVVRQRS